MTGRFSLAPPPSPARAFSLFRSPNRSLTRSHFLALSVSQSFAHSLAFSVRKRAALRFHSPERLTDFRRSLIFSFSRVLRSAALVGAPSLPDYPADGVPRRAVARRIYSQSTGSSATDNSGSRDRVELTTLRPPRFLVSLDLLTSASTRMISRLIERGVSNIALPPRRFSCRLPFHIELR